MYQVHRKTFYGQTLEGIIERLTIKKVNCNLKAVGFPDGTLHRCTRWKILSKSRMDNVQSGFTFFWHKRVQVESWWEQIKSKHDIRWVCKDYHHGNMFICRSEIHWNV